MSRRAERPTGSGRPFGWRVVAVGCAGLLLVGSVLVTGMSTGRGTPGEHGPGSPRAAAPELVSRAVAGDSVQATLDDLTAAWRHRDPAAFVAGSTPASSRWAAVTWRALSALRVGRLELRYVAPAVPRPGSVAAGAAVVEVTWDQAGWESPASTRLTVGLDRSGTGVVSTFARPGSPLSAWAMDRARVVTGPDSTLVISPGRDSRWSPPLLSRLAARAHAQVSAVLGSRLGSRSAGQPLVVVAPGSRAAFGRVLGRSPGDYAGIAAVTTTVDGSVRVDAPSQVVLNPAVFDTLRPLAEQVVLTHEAAHAATGAAGAGMPLWVAEGFADLVALRGSHLPLRVSAGRALAAVRLHGAPHRLPDAADFAAGGAGLARAYEQAWLAFRSLQRRHGTAAVVAFHQAVLAGRPIAAALRATTGSGLGALTAQWRADLSRLARGPA